MHMTIEEFLDENSPDILKQYKAYVSKTLPVIGTTVKSLEWGFGGAPGTILTVKGYAYKGEKSSGDATWGSDYIILTSSGGEYLANMENWWKEIITIK